MNNKFYITTPIYYVNEKPHVGGAYTTIAADVLARFHRMKGDQVFFLTGTDEHGEKIAISAEANHKTPKEWCDENSAKYEEVWDILKISHDNFIRTTDPRHEKAVVKVLEQLFEKKLIYTGTYQGLYCIDCERYYTSKELVDGKCPFHHHELVTLSEDCYFFKLSTFQDILLKLISSNEFLIEPEERKNEILGFLKSERLEDLAVSRKKVKWGIEFPLNKEQTIYVWVDALFNYLSGIDWDGDVKKLPKFWPPEVQLIGKDILRFHAVMWPALLLALELPLPKKLFAHGFFTVNGQKMSKSLGTGVNPEELAVTFGADSLRWLLLSLFPFGQDGDLSESRLYDKYNSDLSNGLGNLVRRVLTLAQDGSEFVPSKIINVEFKEKINSVWQKYEKALDGLHFETAIAQINDLIFFCDKYINQEEPWKLSKTNPDKLKDVLYNLLESLRHLSCLTWPFMPDKSNLILESLGILSQEHTKNLSEIKKFGEGKFEKVSQGQVLFPKIESVK